MNLRENIKKELHLLEETDDRPHNWKELPGYNPEHFHGGDSLDKLRDMMTEPGEDQSKTNPKVDDTEQNDILNTILDRLDYVEELNADMLDFLDNLVKVLKDDEKYRDMAREFTVLLNRSGRRKFYQQSTKRL